MYPFSVFGSSQRGGITIFLEHPVNHWQILTVVLAGTDLAAAAGEQQRLRTVGFRALGLDVLAPDPAHNSPLLVDLKRDSIYSFLV